LSVTVFEHIGRLLSSTDDAPVAGIADDAAGAPASGVAGAAAGAEASGVIGADGGVEASGIAAPAGCMGWAGVVSCAKAAVLSASADAKRIIFILSFLQPLVGE
jgi:hypothetical protein